VITGLQHKIGSMNPAKGCARDYTRPRRRRRRTTVYYYSPPLPVDTATIVRPTPVERFVHVVGLVVEPSGGQQRAGHERRRDCPARAHRVLVAAAARENGRERIDSMKVRNVSNDGRRRWLIPYWTRIRTDFTKVTFVVTGVSVAVMYNNPRGREFTPFPNVFGCSHDRTSAK